LPSLLKVTQTGIRRGIPHDLASEAGGNVHTSGSFRLGLNERGADIDSICVCPNLVEVEDFFGDLQERFMKNPNVTDVVSIPGAKVPMIGFVYEGVDIDLLFARIPVTQVPRNLDICDDNILQGVDEGTMLSLNGPRTTDLIVGLVPNHTTFLKVLRCVRIWAKRRALYSNKIGFLGGVNWAILVGFVCKLYPNASAGKVLCRFFWWMSSWKWPLPIELTPKIDNPPGMDKKIWDPIKYPWDGRDLMPIITPAYPAYNSSFNVNRSTLAYMKIEFSRAQMICDKIMKDGLTWDRLFDKTDFFIRYDYYIMVVVSAKDKDNFRKWHGWVESRLRKLVEVMEGTKPFGCLTGIVPYFKAIKPEHTPNTAWHFIGFALDKKKMHGKTLPLWDVTNFIEDKGEVCRWRDKTEDMTISLDCKKWKDLPKDVHSDGYEVAYAQWRERKGKSTKTAPATTPGGTTLDASAAPIVMDASAAPIVMNVDADASESLGKRARPEESEEAKEDPEGNAKKAKLEDAEQTADLRRATSNAENVPAESVRAEVATEGQASEVPATAASTV